MDTNKLLITGASVAAGGTLGYFIAGKMKKNCWIGAAIGAVVGGAAGYYATTKFSFGEKKSNFVVKQIGNACYCSSGAGAGSYSSACCKAK